MTLKTQMSLGFGTVLALLLVITAASWFGMSRAMGGFESYRALARDANLAAQLESQMLLVRIASKSFVTTKNPEAAATFWARVSDLEDALATAKVEIQKPERAEQVRLIDSEVERYKTGFEAVVKLMEERDEVVVSQLDPNGIAARKNLSAIMESAYADGDVEAAYRAGHALEALMLTRLYVSKFLVENQQEDLTRSNEELSENLRPRLDAMDQALQNPLRRQQLASASQAVSDYSVAIESINVIITERNDIITNQLDAIGPVVAQAADRVRRSVQTDQEQLGDTVLATNTTMLGVILVIALVSLMTSAACAILITRRVVTPLGGEPTDMAALADRLAQGQLQQADINSDATGLNASMQEMTRSLRSLVESVNESAETVLFGASEISMANQELSGRTEQQAASLEETASSLEEITATVTSNAENAVKANSIATDTRTLATEGVSIGEKARAAMTDISDSSKKIAEIITVIDEIAFQTNLLALNAAVEAARAGDQGRGFAVVAAEVRALAERTAVSAKEVSDLISESVNRITDGQELVGACGDSLHQIVDGVGNVSDAISEIASASEQQRSGIEQINAAVTQMDSVTQENAAMVEQAAAAAQNLEASSQQLKAKIGFFDLGTVPASLANSQPAGLIAAS